jgi:anaerobic magnesium-protoporphyrin IX monomethyl ester cyclase
MKKILLVAAYSVIEPLGLLHLGGLARDLGWERKFHLVKDHDFASFFEKVKSYQPEIIGFNIYTGNHIQTFSAIDKLRKNYPDIKIVLGGPHATYFPSDSIEHCDYVVMSEGFRALRRILSDEAERGIIPLSKTEDFPSPDRDTLYSNYPEFGKSKIKSIIGMTGCPYRCTYCYNSSRPEDIKTTPDIAQKIASALGMSGRLFPYNVRKVEDVIKEAEELARNWDTEIIYFQDDVHGFDTKKWLPELAKKWKKRVGIPYHAQMRWEMVVGKGGEERLDLVKEAGCHGLTLAIEAADYSIRKEVLDRGTPQKDMYMGMQNILDRGLKVRTEQITGLPYGATSERSPINLDADLALIELNVSLKEKTGGPTMAWASTFAPYAGTKLGIYSSEFGHYENLDNYDVPDTFFKKSVLRFPKKWEGLSLEEKKDDPTIWLSGSELEEYRTRNASLRGYFNLFCLVPKGHILARKFLTENSDYSPKVLSKFILEHLQYCDSSHAQELLSSIDDLRCNNYNKELEELISYFGCFPKSKLLIERYNKYILSQEGDQAYILSTATRHHLYDEVLYKEEEEHCNDRTD